MLQQVSGQIFVGPCERAGALAERRRLTATAAARATGADQAPANSARTPKFC